MYCLLQNVISSDCTDNPPAATSEIESDWDGTTKKGGHVVTYKCKGDGGETTYESVCSGTWTPLPEPLTPTCRKGI